jgi:nucleosome binding factor SPN SPT16 subunit
LTARLRESIKEAQGQIEEGIKEQVHKLDKEMKATQKQLHETIIRKPGQRARALSDSFWSSIREFQRKGEG